MTTPTQSHTTGANPLVDRLHANLAQVILGKRDAIRLTLCALFSGGHLLMEDVPGTGKTMLARALARSIDAKFSRIQFTPDLLPGDVTGISLFNEGTRQFEFRQGPVFTQILLADELNRTTPRTQSALLEAMAEAQVTADGTTWPMDPFFMVMATQNPIEQHGVYHLPEAQLDRFLMRISVGYPESSSERAMLIAQRERHPLEKLVSVASVEEIMNARRAVREVHVEEDVADYVVRLVAATRGHEELTLGGSPRASLALYRSAQAWTWMSGERFVRPDGVKAVAPAVLRHRLILRPQTRLSGVTPDTIIGDILRRVEVPVER